MTLLVLVPVALLSVRIDFAFVDTFGFFAFVDRTSWRDILSPFAWSARNAVEYRPLHYPLLKLIWTLVGPNVVVWRLVHLLMLTALALLVVRIAHRVARGSSPVAVVCALTSLLGLHTFRFMLLGVPLNMYLMVSMAVVGITLIGLEGDGRWRDAVAVILALGSLWLLETGIIACAIVVFGGVVRPRRFGAGAMWAVIVGVLLYGGARLAFGGTPVPFHAETGFGFHELSVEEQRQHFAMFPMLLYLYNCATSVLSLLLSEPRAGTFKVLGGVLGVEGLSEPLPWQWLNVATSVLATTSIAVWLRRGRVSAEQRYVKQVFLLVLILNAGLSYLYTRDRIMATAGIFYALAFGLAVQDVVTRLPSLTVLRRRAVLGGLATLVLAWGWRSATVLVALRDVPWSTQREWGVRYEQLGGDQPDPDPRTTELKRLLRDRILSQHLEDPEADPAFTHRWFERQF